MLYEGIIAKVFRCTNAFAIAVVVTSRSSSSLYTGSSAWDGLVEVWGGGGFSRYYITYISLHACMHCMYSYGILEGTRAWRYNYHDGEGVSAPENFYKNSKQEGVPTFVWLFGDDATIAKGPICDEGTNLRLRDFAVVPLMPARDTA